MAGDFLSADFGSDFSTDQTSLFPQVPGQSTPSPFRTVHLMTQDLAHWFGQDLNASSTGDLLTVTGIALGQQRILRRLLTNGPGANSQSGDYFWEPPYGAGLAKFIGQPFDASDVAAIIRTQMFLESAVARDPPPSIAVTNVVNGLFVQIQYTDSNTGQIVPLTFTVTPPGLQP